ncbi:MAG: potassium-transporting ATPase subunit B, partial [Comamonadaceae bacterium]
MQTPTARSLRLLDPALVRPALVQAFTKLHPGVQWRNPVMFVVYIGSIVTTLLWLQALRGGGEAPAGFVFAIALWLWFTVLFANFAEALAEGRSKAQAASLRGMKKIAWAKKYERQGAERFHGGRWLPCEGELLRRGDVVLVEAGDQVPA